MKTKPDGFMVSFKPTGANYRSRQLREIPWNTAKHNSNRAEALIQKFDGTFNIVIRPPEGFELPLGCGVLMHVSMQGLSSRGVFGTHEALLSCNTLDAGFFEVPHRDQVRFTTSGFQKLRHGLCETVAKIEAEPGTITVSISVVRVIYNDGVTSRYGPKGPCGVRYWKSHRLSRPDGDLGDTETFVFRPQAKAAFEKSAIRYSHIISEALSPDLAGFTEDATFEAERLVRHQRRQEIHAAWDREQAEISNKSSNDVVVVPKSPMVATLPRNPSPLPSLPLPHVSHQASSAPLQPADTELERSMNLLGATKSGATAKKQAKRSKPAVCTCPEKHETVPRRTPQAKKAGMGNASEALTTIASKPKKPLNPVISHSTKKRPASEPSKKPEETATVACSQCEAIKRAPRGKKIAFRKARGRFMYVPESAPDDDEDQSEALNVPGRRIDQDDEESPLQQGQYKFHMEVGHQRDSDAQVTSKTSASSVNVAGGAVVEELRKAGEVPAEGRSQSSQASRTSEPAGVNEETGPLAMSGEPETAMETVAQTSASPETSMPPATVPANGAASGIVVEGPELAPEQQISGQAENSKNQTTQVGMDAEDSLAHVVTPSEMKNTLAASETTESRKRGSRSVHAERPSKQRRVDVDLTKDDDGDIIAVKTEMSRAKDRQGVKSVGDEEKDELEARLEEIALRQKQVEFQLEANAVRQKLRRLERRGSRAQETGFKDEIKLD